MRFLPECDRWALIFYAVMPSETFRRPLIFQPFHLFFLIKIMHWPIPEIPDLFSDQPRSKWKHLPVWCAGWLLLLLLVLAAVFLLDLSLLYVLIPCVAGLLVALGVFIVAFNRQMAEEAWEKEKADIHRSWTNWANRRVALIDARMMLPDELAVNAIVEQSGMRYVGRYFMFARNNGISDNWLMPAVDAEWEYTGRLLGLFDYGLPVTVHIAAEPLDLYEYWGTVFTEAASRTGFSKLSLNRLEERQDILNDWFEQEFDGIHVVFSILLNNDRENPEFTESMTWLVFASDQWVAEQGVAVKQYVHRPLDMPENAKDTATALQHFCRYGVKFQPVNALWLPGKSEDERMELMGKLETAGMQWQPLAFKSLLCQPELYMSEIPKTDYWMSLGLAAENMDPVQIFGWPHQDVYRLVLLKQPEEG